MRNTITKAITKHSAFHAKRTPKQKQKQKMASFYQERNFFLLLFSKITSSKEQAEANESIK